MVGRRRASSPSGPTQRRPWPRSPRPPACAGRSLYYYFGRKELILEAAFGLTRAPAELIRQLRRHAPRLALFRLLHRDATQLCLTPCDVNEVWRVARVEAELFAEFWEDRRELHRRVEGFVSKGAGDGSFHEVDARLTALNLVAADEGAQNWWRQRDLNRLDGRPRVRPSRFTPEELADLNSPPRRCAASCGAPLS